MSFACAPLFRNIVAAAVSLIGAKVWTKTLVFLSRTNRIGNPLTRKLMHIGTAPLFTCTWPLYSRVNPLSRFLAAGTPLLFALSIIRDPARNELISSICRDEHEEAKFQRASGPLSYALSVSAITILTWTSPHTFIALAALIFGDAMADVIGSAFHTPIILKSPKRKTIGGSVAFFTATVLSASVWQHISILCRNKTPLLTTPHIITTAAICTLVEIIPVEDNFSVPFAALATSAALARFH